MKFWQKIFLAALLISIIFVNVGVYAVFEITYQENIESEKSKGILLFDMTEKTLKDNMELLKKKNELQDERVKRMLRMYEIEMMKRQMKFSMWKDGQILYGEKKKLPVIAEYGEKVVEISGNRGEKVFEGICEFENGENHYHFYMAYPLKELNDAWMRLKQIYLVISVGITIILAIALFIIIRIMMRPLKKLTDQIVTIKEGDYKERILIKGEDEISDLSKNVNEMAEVIEQQIQCLEKENEKKQQFINDLAHEMKSPLTSIYGYAEYMTKAKLKMEENYEFCNIIMEESKRLEALSHQLLVLCELKEVELKMSNFSLKRMCEQLELVEKERGFLEKEQYVVSFVADDNEMYGNRELLELMLNNLILNAKRATDATRKNKITVILKKNQFVVEDTGTGIEKEELDKIREPFYRIDKGRSRKEGGNGIGLALCDQIIKCHNGIFEIDSKVGEGTRILIQFRVEE